MTPAPPLLRDVLDLNDAALGLPGAETISPERRAALLYLVGYLVCRGATSHAEVLERCLDVLNADLEALDVIAAGILEERAAVASGFRRPGPAQAAARARLEAIRGGQGEIRWDLGT